MPKATKTLKSGVVLSFGSTNNQCELRKCTEPQWISPLKCFLSGIASKKWFLKCLPPSPHSLKPGGQLLWSGVHTLSVAAVEVGCQGLTGWRTLGQLALFLLWGKSDELQRYNIHLILVKYLITILGIMNV